MIGDYRIEVPGLQTIACLLLSVPVLAFGMERSNVLCLIAGTIFAVLAAIGYSQYWRDVDLILAEVEQAALEAEKEELEEQLSEAERALHDHYNEEDQHD